MTRTGHGRDPVERSQLRMAFSVYFYAEHDDDAWVHPEFRPIPIDEAARILAAGAMPADDSCRESRRRRAIAKLAAAGLEPPRHSALEILAAPIDDIRRAFEKAGGGLDRAQREAIVYEIIDVPPVVSDCMAKAPKVNVEPDIKHGATRVTVELSAKRQGAGLRVAMDRNAGTSAATRTSKRRT